MMENAEEERKLPKDPKTAAQLGPLVLAYMGDAVYEQFVRSELISEHGQEAVYRLHMRAVEIVCARAQAATAAAIFEDLTEEERAVYRRGRNAKSNTLPKNASVAQYRAATGFEALIGYLYLSGNRERLLKVLSLAKQRGWRKYGRWDKSN